MTVGKYYNQENQGKPVVIHNSLLEEELWKNICESWR